MGTNYYLNLDAYLPGDGRVFVALPKDPVLADFLEEAGHIKAANAIRGAASLSTYEPPRLHIGKSSGGWCFCLHVYPDDHGLPKDLDGWMEAFDRGTIVDEYGVVQDPTFMLAWISDRPGKEPPVWGAAEYRMNNAVPGPRGLVRHAIQDGHCIGHGDGTYDLIVGEFF